MLKEIHGITYKRHLDRIAMKWAVNFDLGYRTVDLYFKIKNLRSLSKDQLNTLLKWAEDNYIVFYSDKEEEFFFNIFKHCKYSSLDDIITAIEEAKDIGVTEIEGKQFRW